MRKSSLSARKPYANLCQKRYHIVAIILIKLSVMVFGVSAKDTFTTVSPTLKQYGFLICSMKERILSSLGRLRSIFTFRISTSSSKAFPFLSLFFSIFSSPPYIVIVTRNFLSYSGNYHRQKNRQNALCVLSIVFTYKNLLSSKLTSKASSISTISFSSSFPRYCIILCLSIVLSCSKSAMEG